MERDEQRSHPPPEADDPRLFVEARASVDYLLRTTETKLVQLSAMADQKANIVISSALLMITIVVGIASSSRLTASLATLGAAAAVAAVVALLAVMPSSNGRRRDGAANPLYFGDAAHMTRAEHADRLGCLLDDDQTLYGLLARDIHEQALVLQHRKFRYLRVSYVIFIVGLVATAVVVTAEWATGNL